MPAVPKPVKQEKERSYNSLRRKPGGAEKRSIDYSGFAFPKPAPPKKKRRSYGGLKKQGYCHICGAAGWTEWHHIIYRSQGGDESPENLIEVCPKCHGAIHRGEISREALDTVGRLIERSKGYGERACGAGQ